MTGEEFENLQAGDIVRGKFSAESYIVTANFKGRVTAVRTVDLTNPEEWELIQKATQPDSLDLPKPSRPSFE